MCFLLFQFFALFAATGKGVTSPVFALAILSTFLPKHSTTLYGPNQRGFSLSPFLHSLAEFLNQTKLPVLNTYVINVDKKSIKYTDVLAIPNIL